MAIASVLLIGTVAAPARGEGQGLYVWNPALAMTGGGEDDRRLQLELLEFCARKGVDVRRLYFLVEPDRTDPAALRDLVRRAGHHGVDVYALHPGGLQHAWLAGYRRRGSANHDAVLGWIDRALALAPGLAGIQLDVEPHLARAGRRRAWRADGGLGSKRNRRIAREYLELLERVRDRLDRGSGPRPVLAATAPTWFDGDSGGPFEIEVGSVRASLIAHVQRRVDFVTLMNYVGDATPESSARALENITHELAGGPVESLFETSKPRRRGAGREETLYRAGLRGYDRLCAALREALRDEPNFLGCAAHQYGDAYGGRKRRWRVPR